ncbi:MucBP domain-containing protein [Pseudobutyrivibrio ruminis]|uniref:MucBP domain-containing protein n=1 Tax=Pseudobutyrivibrio ruminis TaxID=46206 RepID=UPI000404F9EF|nr:MucBP domain-containing protein [Pseudobutyrivibrio ruminis]
MKKMNRFFGLLLAMLIVSAGVMSISTVSYADYQYTVRIYLGGTGDEGASFTSSEGSAYLDYKVDAGNTFSFNPTTEVTISSTDAKYQVIGLRPSGDFNHEKLVDNISGKTIDKDETYVVAYGTYKTVPYTAEFVNEAGTKISEDLVYYGIKGKTFNAPYKEIDGYVPKDGTKNKAITLTESDEVVQFVYTNRGTGSTIYNTIENTEYSTVRGANQRVTQTIPGETQPADQSAVTNNRNQDNRNQGAATDDSLAVETDVANDTEVDDSTTPAISGNEETEIPDEDVARAVGDRKTITNYFIYLIIIAILGFLIVCISVIGTVVVNYDKKHKN